MNNIIKRVWNQNKMVNIEALQGMTFQAESGGHTFEISGVDDTGAVVPLSGTVAGVFMRPDRADIALVGSASDGVVSVTLTDDCYAIPGRFGLTIFVTYGGQKTAVYAAVGTVAVTSGGAVAGETPQDVVDLINAIAAAVATIPADYTDLMTAIAPIYSTTALYNVGSYVWHDGHLYRCTTPITTAETWTAAHWTTAVLGDDDTYLKNEVIYSEKQDKTINHLLEVGFTPGVSLNNDGGIGANQNWKTTSDFVPVVAGEYYNTTSSLVPFTILRATYNSSKNLVGFAVFSQETSERFWLIPDGVSFVKFSVPIGVNDFGLRPFANIFDESKDIPHSIETTQNELDMVDYVNSLGWTVGRLKSDGTIDQLITDAVTIGDYIPVKPSEAISFISKSKTPGTYSFYRCVYDSNKSLIQYTVFTTNNGETRTYQPISGASYVRVSFPLSAIEDGYSIIKASNIPAIAKLEFGYSAEYGNYTGAKPDMSALNKYSISKMFPAGAADALDANGNYKTEQGFAVYQNTLFQAYADDLLRLFDVKARKPLRDISVAIGHGNQLTISQERYDADDPYPLIYCSDIDGKCYACRVTDSGATITKTLYFPSSTFGYFGELSIDELTGNAYVFGSTGNDGYLDVGAPLIVSKVNMNSMTQNLDGTYTPAVLDSFTVTPPARTILQQIDVVNNMIFAPNGGYPWETNSFVMISPEQKGIMNVFDGLPARLKAIELEGVSHMINDKNNKYDLILLFRNDNYYKVSV